MLTQGDHRRHLFAAGVAAAGLLLGIAGCSDSTPTDPTPARTTTATPRPSSTPAPSAPTPPVLPEQVRTEEGAVAMMRYVLEAYTYAFSTNDTGPLDAVATEGCTFCENVRADVNAHAQARQVIVGGEIEPSDETAVDVGDDGFFGGDLTMVEAPSQLVDASGAVVDRLPGGRYAVNFSLQWRDSRWRVLDVGAKPLTDG